MNIWQRFVNFIAPSSQSPDDFLSGVELMDIPSESGEVVTVRTSRNVATAYRCINILSDDVAKLPLQLFDSPASGKISRVRPNALTQNAAWLIEVSPNRYTTPFIFKKAAIMWLVTRGAAYIWMTPRAPGRRVELFLLPTSVTRPILDDEYNLWYEVTMPGQPERYYPDSEVLSLLLNSDDGIAGRGVIEYARDTIGRQLANYRTQNKIAGKGLNPSGVIWMAGELDQAARKKIREVYEASMRDNGVVVFDPKVTKFESITMKPTDAQFLESIQENDQEVANYFGVPLYKLNQGKQSYQSNEQQNLDYLNTTLDPYLIQWEQGALLKWLSISEQSTQYFRFNRDALLRTDAKTRSETLEKRIFSGQLTPNEARQIEDASSYPGGDGYYIPSNMARVDAGGNLITGGGNA